MTNPDFLIDYSQIPPASSVAEAIDGFAARADVVTNYYAWRKEAPLAGELFKNELDATTVAIARLEKVHQARLRAGRIPSLRYFLTTHSFDPSEGIRAFLAKFAPQVASYRELVEFDDAGQTTSCPACKRALIRRSWHDILEYNLDGDRCTCGERIAGVFAAGAKHPPWRGAWRRPLR
jgi:hypothetical protein